MGRGIAVLVLMLGLSWSLLLLPWVTVLERSLTGAELSQILVSLPAVSILMALIALYRKFPRVLVIASGLVMVMATFLAITTDFALAPASLQLQESITGLAGETGLGEQTIWPYVFAAFTAASGLLSLWVSTLRVSKKLRVDESGGEDARSIWDEQL